MVWAALVLATSWSYETRMVEGWTVKIRQELLVNQKLETEAAVAMLRRQLYEINRVVPAAAVQKLKKVHLYFSPNYPGERAAAAYHPGAGWLRDNGRDPAMAKAVEFSNMKDMRDEVRRMPGLTLHELAHAYHDQFLPGGFGNPDLATAYDAAMKTGQYNRVERRDAFGKSRFDKAYAATNPMEYFAEGTEAYFTRNDFFPFVKDELQRHDPALFALMPKLWGS